VHLYESSQKDYVEAVKWFRKAAEQGHALAQYNLGCCYDNGYGVSKDYLVAAKWYRKAAYQNFAPSQYSISLLYLRGLGVPQDFVEAYKWTKLAALKQHSDSIEQLDSMNGLITSAQKTEAMQFVETFCGDEKKQDPGNPLRSAATSTTTKPTTATSIATHALLSDKELLLPVRGKVSLRVDQVTRPGAIVSGKVTFSDGQQTDWFLDQTGHLGVVPKQQGYKPSAADLQARLLSRFGSYKPVKKWKKAK
jgi:tetratricopeptide (TPR) repeat protein